VLESVNMFATLYGQRERLVSRVVGQTEDESTRASALVAITIILPTVLAWAITIAINGMLLLMHKEVEAMFGEAGFT
jgi:hypothetical protein